MHAIPTATPRFSGFYEVKASQTEIDRLPLLKNSKVPIPTYCMGTDTCYMYVPQGQDEAFKAQLQRIPFKEFSLKAVLAIYIRRIESDLAQGDLQIVPALLKALGDTEFALKLKDIFKKPGS